MKIANQTVLAISPHTDDIELAAGGTLIKLIKDGNRVHYIALSDCQNTLNKTKFEKDTLTKECSQALSILGLKQKHISIHHHSEKYFYKEKREIFTKLEDLRDKLKPDLIIIPSLKETHEDHRVVADQALTVFRRHTSIICYEQPWNNLNFQPSLYIDLSEKILKIKLLALSSFKTQEYFKKSYFSQDFILGMARLRGEQIMSTYAEAFEIVKLII